MINLDSISAFCRHLGWTVNESSYAITFTKTEKIPNSVCSVPYQIDAPNSPQGVIDVFDKENKTFNKDAVIMNALKTAETASPGVPPISKITGAAERIQRSIENINYSLRCTDEDKNLQKIINIAQQIGFCAYLSPNEFPELGYYGGPFSEYILFEYGDTNVRALYLPNNSIEKVKHDLNRCMRKEGNDDFKEKLKELLHML